MRTIFTYFLLFFSLAALVPLVLLLPPGKDHTGAIALEGEDGWYMNFRRSNKMYYQDRDVLYHHIGESIEHAKQADIIILGHSMAVFGIDWRMLEAFAAKHRIRIFNLATPSDAAGEFGLRIVEKYQLHPALWLINADDHENSFFRNFVQYAKPGAAGRVMAYDRWQAYKNVIGKNLSWRMEILLGKWLPQSLLSALYPYPSVFTYRSSLHGNWNNDFWPNYLTHNASFSNGREPGCHARPEEFEWADTFLGRLGGGDVVLTQIPHTNSCRPRVAEIAKHLGVPFISVGWQGMTAFDGGGHLDGDGAKKFTTEMLKQLEQTPAFKKLIATRQAQAR